MLSQCRRVYDPDSYCDCGGTGCLSQKWRELTVTFGCPTYDRSEDFDLKENKSNKPYGWYRKFEKRKLK